MVGFILPVLYWIIYFGVSVEWRLARLRGRGPIGDWRFRLFGTVLVLVAVLTSLIATINLNLGEGTLSGGAAPGGGNQFPQWPKIRVRLRQQVEDWPFEELRHYIERRWPVSVIQGGQEPRSMHLEELIALFYETESRRNRVYTFDGDSQPVLLSEVLPLWNEAWKLMLVLDRDNVNGLRYNIFYPSSALFYYKNPFFPPLETDIEQAMHMIQFDRMLQAEGFDVMDDDGVRRTTLEGLNDINAQFSIYVRENVHRDKYVELTWLVLEHFYHEYPQVWVYGEWHLATPDLLRHIDADPTLSNPPVLAMPPAPTYRHLERGIRPDWLIVPLPRQQPEVETLDSAMRDHSDRERSQMDPELVDTPEQEPDRLPEKALYGMNYAHYGGYCLNGTTPTLRPCRADIEHLGMQWGWIQLRGTKEMGADLRKANGPRLQRVLYHKLAKQKYAIEDFALSPVLDPSPFHLIVVAYLEEYRNLIAAGLIHGFEDFVYTVVDLHKKTDFIRNIEKTGIEASSTVKIRRQDIVNKVRKFHGAAPRLRCRSAPGSSERTILNRIEVCFDRSRNQVNCPRVRKSQLDCTEEVYLMPLGSLPSNQELPSEPSRLPREQEDALSSASTHQGGEIAAAAAVTGLEAEEGPERGETETREAPTTAQTAESQAASAMCTTSEKTGVLPGTSDGQKESTPRRTNGAVFSMEYAHLGAPQFRNVTAKNEPCKPDFEWTWFGLTPAGQDYVERKSALKTARWDELLHTELTQLRDAINKFCLFPMGATSYHPAARAFARSSHALVPKYVQSFKDYCKKVVTMHERTPFNESMELEGVKAQHSVLVNREHVFSLVKGLHGAKPQLKCTAFEWLVEDAPKNILHMLRLCFDRSYNPADCNEDAVATCPEEFYILPKEPLPQDPQRKLSQQPDETAQPVQEAKGVKEEPDVAESSPTSVEPAVNTEPSGQLPGDGENTPDLSRTEEPPPIAVEPKTTEGESEIKSGEEGAVPVETEPAPIAEEQEIVAVVGEVTQEQEIVTVKEDHRSEEPGEPGTSGAGPEELPSPGPPGNAEEKSTATEHLGVEQPEGETRPGVAKPGTEEAVEDDRTGEAKSSPSTASPGGMRSSSTTRQGVAGLEAEKSPEKGNIETREAVTTPRTAESQVVASAMSATSEEVGALPGPSDGQRQKKKAVFLMEYAHLGGYCLRNITAQNVRCKRGWASTNLEWTWVRLGPAEKDEVEKMSSAKHARWNTVLKTELTRMRDAIDRFCVDPLEGSKYHTIARAFARSAQGLVPKYIPGFKEYCKKVLILHQRTPFNASMELEGIKAQDSVVANKNHVASLVKGLHGAEPWLKCRPLEYSDKGPLNNILYLLQLCFDESYNPADCNEAAGRVCAEEFYIVPKESLPQIPPRKSSHQPDETVEQKPLHEMEGEKKELGGAESSPTSVEPEVTTEPSGALPGDGENTPDLARTEEPSPIAVEPRTTEGVSGMKSGEEGAVPKETKPAPVAEEPEIVAVVREVPKEEEMQTVKEDPESKEPGESGSRGTAPGEVASSGPPGNAEEKSTATEHLGVEQPEGETRPGVAKPGTEEAVEDDRTGEAKSSPSTASPGGVRLSAETGRDVTGLGAERIPERGRTETRKEPTTPQISESRVAASAKSSMLGKTGAFPGPSDGQRQKKKAVFLMEYAHLGGYCLRNITAQNVRCKRGWASTNLEWTWVRLGPAEKDEVEKMSSAKHARWNTVLKTELTRMRDAIDRFCVDPLEGSKYHTIARAFARSAQGLVPKYIPGFKEYCKKVLILHQRTPFNASMELEGIKAQDSVVANKNHVASLVKGLHGAEPWLKCRPLEYSDKGPLNNILYLLQLCFDESYNPADCNEAAGRVCAEEFYIVPKESLPQIPPRESPQQPDETVEQKPLHEMEGEKKELEGAESSPTSVEPEVTTEPSGALPGDGENTPDPVGTEKPPPIAVEPRTTEGESEIKSGEEGAAPKEIRPAPVAEELEIVAVVREIPQEEEIVTVKEDPMPKEPGESGTRGAAPEELPSSGPPGNAEEKSTATEHFGVEQPEGETRPGVAKPGTEEAVEDDRTGEAKSSPSTASPGGMRSSSTTRQGVAGLEAEKSPEKGNTETREAVTTSRTAESQVVASAMSATSEEMGAVPGPSDGQRESTRRSKKEPVFLMEYSHIGGFRFQNVALKDKPCKPDIEWSWVRLAPAEKDDVEKMSTSKSARWDRVLKTELTQYRDAIDKFCIDPLEGSKYHPVARAFTRSAHGLVPRYVQNFKDYCKKVVDLHERTPFNASMELEGIKAQHSVLVKKKHITSLIKGLHGAEPWLRCRTLDFSVKEVNNNILYLLQLCFDESLNPADCKEVAALACADEFYIVPKKPPPQDQQSKLSQQPGETQEKPESATKTSDVRRRT